MPFAVKARLVFLVSGPPLRDAAVTIDGERIVAVGAPARDGVVEDLGNVALVPGLVNAHAHLEYSELDAPLGERGIAFPDWIRRVIDYKRATGGPRAAAIERGLAECLRHGTTSLGEIASPGWPRGAFAAAPQSATVFLELIGLSPERIAERLALARDHLALPGARWRAGLSPHAPYSVRFDALPEIVGVARAANAPLAMHLAESLEEYQLLRSGGGPFRELLEELNVWDETALPRRSRPLDYLAALAEGPRTLVVHGNYLDAREISFLAERARRMAVVYCPRTHDWFGHPRHPLPRLLAAGAAVALGTDGRASNPDLSLLAEMRFVAAHFPELPAADVLRLGTLAGAQALGRDREIGTLQAGKRADLVAVALDDRDASDPHELLFDSAQPVVGTMIRGRWAWRASS